jgi:hypothetical protein
VVTLEIKSRRARELARTVIENGRTLGFDTQGHQRK